ncbi:Rieske 2Fe-2S domain-containing protein [Saccharopolyspora spinosa]|uniref:Rieske 2Fe-2S domain-containing protein n=1 Tax=Saccharopolyspora spinosa TaxID=60894 RepID=UPI0011D28C55
MKIRSYTPPGSQNQPQEASPAPPPLPYPNGWFCVGFSTEWLPGVVQTRPFMGEDLVIYRTRSGKLRASRPYCPHLGSTNSASMWTGSASGRPSARLPGHP